MNREKILELILSQIKFYGITSIDKLLKSSNPSKSLEDLLLSIPLKEEEQEQVGFTIEQNARSREVPEINSWFSTQHRTSCIAAGY